MIATAFNLLDCNWQSTTCNLPIRIGNGEGYKPHSESDEDPFLLDLHGSQINNRFQLSPIGVNLFFSFGIWLLTNWLGLRYGLNDKDLD